VVAVTGLVCVAAAAVAAVVCAAAEDTNASNIGNTKINDMRMRLTTPPTVSHQCCGAEQRSATSAFETA
jgi:hypothetical protein